jgi:hypothetical protein
MRAHTILAQRCGRRRVSSDTRLKLLFFDRMSTGGLTFLDKMLMIRKMIISIHKRERQT